MNIYVGNLAYTTTEEELTNLFQEYGAVSSVNIITDKYSGRAKGFAFVEMESQEEAQKAIASLNDTQFKERNIRVNEAKPKPKYNEGGNRSRGR
ncbi:MAG: RNA-binding protein [Spirochaetia bacterium]|nr:RNA-binding protein [Spirochaetia bacterium]